MARFFNSLVYRHTLTYLCLLVVSEVVVFGALYVSTVALYSRRTESEIRSEISTLHTRLAGLAVDGMADVIRGLCNDEPGEFDEYMLAGPDFRYIAGNVEEWPRGLSGSSDLTEVALGRPDTGRPEDHRVMTTTLPSGEYLLVGRNLTELDKLRRLIVRALGQTIGLTLAFGLGGGFAFSKLLAARLDRINRTTHTILAQGLDRRVPLTGTDDEIDALARSLNRMLDRIQELIDGMRNVGESIAHDLRRPISRLRSRVELTLMGPERIADYRAALEQTVEEADEILKIFNALLTISLAETGAAPERCADVDLVEVARSAVELYGPAAEEAGLDLDLVSDDEVRVVGDRQLLSLALSNMLDNAIKHAPGTGRLDLEVTAASGRGTLSQADRGPGIPAGFRERAFERFARLDASRSTTGSGLGLSLVRAVVRLHGGSVELLDNAPGLRIVLDLPLDLE